MHNPDFSAEFRALALAAGVSADDLDGPPRCFAGCGVTVRRIAATCGECTAKRVESEHAAGVRRAWATVPKTLQWAALEKPKLLEWVRDSAAVARARELAKDLRAHPFVTLIGPQSSGKTTLACAYLREWVRPGWSAKAPVADRAVSRRVRFTTAQELLEERTQTRLGEHVVGIDLARSASVLVLDELGRGSDPQGVIFSLIHERHRERRPTIMTSPHETADAFAAATRDGGLARRVFDESQQIVVRGKAGAS